MLPAQERLILEAYQHAAANPLQTVVKLKTSVIEYVVGGTTPLPPELSIWRDFCGIMEEGEGISIVPVSRGFIHTVTPISAAEVKVEFHPITTPDILFRLTRMLSQLGPHEIEVRPRHPTPYPSYNFSGYGGTTEHSQYKPINDEIIATLGQRFSSDSVFRVRDVACANASLACRILNAFPNATITASDPDHENIANASSLREGLSSPARLILKQMPVQSIGEEGEELYDIGIASGLFSLQVFDTSTEEMIDRTESEIIEGFRAFMKTVVLNGMVIVTGFSTCLFSACDFEEMGLEILERSRPSRIFLWQPDYSWDGHYYLLRRRNKEVRRIDRLKLLAETRGREVGTEKDIRNARHFFWLTPMLGLPIYPAEIYGTAFK